MVKVQKNWHLIMACLIAASFLSATVVHDEKSYNELCSYDPKFCKKLKGHGLTGSYWKEPDENLLAMMEKDRDDIITFSKKYGVDPRAVAACFVTENTLNVNMVDSIQDFLVSSGASKDGTVLGKAFTFGPGQINIDRAMSVEEAAAKLMGRTPRTREVVAQLLLKDKDSIEYVAAILKDAQDTYAKHGFDVSKDIGVLTTLYNIGNVERHAQETQQSGKVPRVNYFGYFSQTHVAYLEEAIKWDPSMAQSPISVAPPAQVATKLQDTLKAPVKISEFVPQCGADLTHSSQVTPIAAAPQTSPTGPYTVLGHNVDCEMKAWSLIQFNDKKLGWAQDSELQNGSQKIPQLAPPHDCKADNNSNCSQEVRAIVKTKIVKANVAAGHFESHVYGAPTRGRKPSVKNYSPLCSQLAYQLKGRDVLYDQEDNGGYKLGRDVPFTKADRDALTEITPTEASELTAKIEKAYQNTKNSTDSDQWGWAYQLYFCSPKCYANVKKINAFLDSSEQNRGMGVEAVVYSSVPKTDAENNVKMEQNQKIRSSCGTVAQSAYYDAYVKYDNLLNSIRTAANSIFSGSEPFGANFDRLLEFCTAIQTLSTTYKIKDDDSATTASNAGCPSCQTGAPPDKEDGSKLIGQTVDALKHLKPTSQQIGKAFGKLVDNLTSDLENEKEEPCLYHPGYTLNLIQKLSDKDCIDKVYVPDYFLYKMLKTKLKDKVVLMDFPNHDRFSVQLKTTCGSAASPSGATP